MFSQKTIKIGLLSTMLAIGQFQLQAHASPMPKQLQKGVTIKDKLTADSTHVYEINLAEGQFVFGDAMQISVDLKVSVYEPNGERLVSFDGPARGSENFQFGTTMAGKYQIKITPFEQAEGDYSIRLIKQEPLATTPQDKVSQLMSAFTDNTPGAIVAIVRDGKLAYGQGFGLANVEYDIPNTVSTPYHMASVSKQFTAFAIVMLANEGKLSMDEDIRKYLPEMPEFEHTITVRHLLNHTSGLRDHWTLWRMSGGLMDDVIRQNDLMRLIKRQKDLNFKPGKQFMYSNTGYLLLSEIVTHVSGQPFGDWMKDNVFNPLGMHSTQIYDDHERIVKNRAYSYKTTNEGLAKSVLSYANSGATSLFTTAQDLALWLGNFKTGKVGGKKAIEQLQVQGVLNDGKIIEYALGIGIEQEHGLKKIAHGGADAGYRTYLSYYPELDAGMIIMANTAGFNGGLIAQDIASAFFGEHMNYESEPEPESANTHSQPAPNKPKQEPWKPSAKELMAFTGRYYSDELDTFYVITVQDDRLKVSHTRHGESFLRPTKKDVFRSSQRFLGILEFKRSTDNKVKQISVSSGRVRNLTFDKVKP